MTAASSRFPALRIPKKLPRRALPAPPAFAVRAALRVRKAFLRAADAVVPAQLAVFERVAATAGSVVITELARLRVADLVAERPLTAAEIASRTATDPDAMSRTMRAAVAMGLFVRDRDGRFANNRLSRGLRTDDAYSVRSFAEYFGSGSNMSAWLDFRGTLRTGGSAFDRVHGKSIWEWFEDHPDEREMFAQCMMTMTLAQAPGIAAAYPWSELRSVCDVGGGRGTLVSELLVQHAHLVATLCDAPGVLELARPLLADRGVAARVRYAPGSFFEPLPGGSDAYVLKNVLHDWNDERCLAILRNCRAAMGPGTKLLVIEAIVGGEPDAFSSLGALADLQMMVVCEGGRERSRADFERLLEASGFRLGRVIPTPTPMTILEGVAL